MKKPSAILYVILIICILGAGLGLVFLKKTQQDIVAPNTKTQPDLTATEPASLQKMPVVTNLVLVGDIMLDRGVAYSVNKNFAGDYSNLFENTEDLKNDDVLFGNLEGPASDQGADKYNLYSFRMTPEAPQILKDAGFDIVSFANNHVGDWGRAAFEDTLARLTSAGLKYTGAGMTKEEAIMPTIIEHGGIKIGFLGFSDVGPNDLAADETHSGILLASDPNYDAIISAAKSQVDALIVSMHAGVEYQEHTKRQTDLARRAIDDGATIFVGTHPHVAQAVERYGTGIIFYSLGNFIFDQAFSKETMQGMVAEVALSDAKISSVKIGTSYLNKFFQIEKIEFNE